MEVEGVGFGLLNKSELSIAWIGPLTEKGVLNGIWSF